MRQHITIGFLINDILKWSSVYFKTAFLFVLLPKMRTKNTHKTSYIDLLELADWLFSLCAESIFTYDVLRVLHLLSAAM